VTVNGAEAEVDVGIGTNGTFFAQGVALSADGPTAIEAVATKNDTQSTVRIGAQAALRRQPLLACSCGRIGART